MSNLLLGALLWLPLAATAAGAVTGTAVSVFNHGNVALPDGIERGLRRMLVTPDMHRIHHSAVVSESNRNFSNVFPWWHRLFGTYQRAPARDHRGMDLGLEEARSPADDVTMGKLLLLPFRSRAAVARA